MLSFRENTWPFWLLLRQRKAFQISSRKSTLSRKIHFCAWPRIFYAAIKALNSRKRSVQSELSYLPMPLLSILLSNPPFSSFAPARTRFGIVMAVAIALPDHSFSLTIANRMTFSDFSSHWKKYLRNIQHDVFRNSQDYTSKDDSLYDYETIRPCNSTDSHLTDLLMSRKDCTFIDTPAEKKKVDGIEKSSCSIEQFSQIIQNPIFLIKDFLKKVLNNVMKLIFGIQ